jgi:hypothetical protein
MPELVLRPAWQRNNRKIAADAVDLWQRLNALPRGTSPDQRIKELCAAAYYDGDIAGVSTVTVKTLPPFPCRFAFYRCLVAPEHRLLSLSRRLTLFSRDIICEWSRQHPEEKVLGSIAVLENPKGDALAKIPVWKVPGVSNGYTLAGYTRKGLQVRIHWYDHARLD